MEEALPFVSVIVPVYNAEGMVGDCIESLLNQDYPKDRYEIIIVDNDSTDGTAEVIRRYPVKYMMEREMHTCFAAEDTGARASRGELLAFCDSDETATPSRVRTLVCIWRGSLRRRLFLIGMNILMLMANLHGKLRYRFGGSVGRNW